ncbi:hypothetical protein CMT37_17005 [Elizabethkingia anophelis]|nr:hypothetical protein [Elizabethkingia anophelis]
MADGDGSSALSAIPVVGGLLNGLFSNNSARKVAKENREFALDMWNRNNEYNTPTNQMARLKEAGLNPNLMYGQGTTGNSSSPAAAEGRKGTNYDMGFMEAAQLHQQLKMNEQTRQLQKAQTQNLEAQTLKTEAETENTRASTLNTSETTEYNRKLRPMILQKYGVDIANTQLTNENLQKINSKIDAEIDQIKANTNLSGKQLQSLEQLMGKTAIEIQNAKKQGQSIDLNNAEQQFKNDLWKKGINPGSTGANGLIDWLRNNVLDKVYREAYKYYPKIPR